MSNDDLDCVNQIVERIKSQEHLIKKSQQGNRPT